MDQTTKSPVHLISSMYEAMLFEFSYDLHERYSHLLASLLHNIEQGSEEHVLISHIIDEMRRRSNEMSPLSLRDYGVAAAFKRHAKEVEHRYGLPIVFPSSYKLTNVYQENAELAFRLLQLTLLTIIEQTDTENIEITADYDRVKFCFQSFAEELPLNQEDLLEVLKNGTSMEMDLQREGNRWNWIWYRRLDQEGEME